MDTVAPLAGTLSTYGLYAIVTALSIAVVYLYKRQDAIQREVRDMLKTTINDNNKVISENTRALNDAAKLIEVQAEALKDRKR